MKVYLQSILSRLAALAAFLVEFKGLLRVFLSSAVSDARLMAVRTFAPVIRSRIYKTQVGYAIGQVLIGLFVGVIVLVMIITFLWQTGIPEVISATSNTTALEAAGATQTQINWAVFIGGTIIILLFLAALIMAFKMVPGLSGGGGGGRRSRRKKK